MHLIGVEEMREELIAFVMDGNVDYIPDDQVPLIFIVLFSCAPGQLYFFNSLHLRPGRNSIFADILTLLAQASQRLF